MVETRRGQPEGSDGAGAGLHHRRSSSSPPHDFGRAVLPRDSARLKFATDNPRPMREPSLTHRAKTVVGPRGNGSFKGVARALLSLRPREGALDIGFLVRS